MVSWQKNLHSPANVERGQRRLDRASKALELTSSLSDAPLNTVPATTGMDVVVVEGALIGVDIGDENGETVGHDALVQSTRW